MAGLLPNDYGDGGLLGKLVQTWPARLGRGILNAVATPGGRDRGNFGTMSSAEEGLFSPTGLDNTFSSFANEVAKDVLHTVMIPGNALNGKYDVKPEKPGWISEEDLARQAMAKEQMIKDAFQFAGLVTLGAGAVPAEANSLRAGIKAYHGSPHDFDRFDMGKIGTGEGAQAYGHGLYFAENEATAKSYRDSLTARYDTDAKAKGLSPRPIAIAQRDLQAFNGDIPAYISSQKNKILETAEKYGASSKFVEDEFRKLDALSQHLKEAPRGHMYEVNINADPAHFLDWDKPLSGQSGGVRAALENLGIKYDAKGNKAYTDALLDALTGDANRALPKEVSNPLGSELYRRSGSVFQSSSDPMRSAAFREAGIPGIKYLDQVSRGAGEGSRNYVVFDDKLIDILRKYGLAGATASPLAALMYGQGQEINNQ